MKYIIASDLHGSAYYTKKLIEKFNELECEKMLLLGDILYHGPRNDLPKEYAPKQVIAMLNPLKDKIICVKGNCDAEVDQMVLDFNISRSSHFLNFEDHEILMTHGHKINPDNPPKMKDGSIVLYGHTHIPFDKVINGIRFINPGSVSIPKNGSNHSFILFEDGVFTFMSLED